MSLPIMFFSIVEQEVIESLKKVRDKLNG